MKFPIRHIEKVGRNEDFNFEVNQHKVNIQKTLTSEQTLKVLKDLKRVVSNEPCKAVDSNTLGDKYTHCNWGMCTDDPRTFSEPAMHIWPYQFMNDGRVAPLQRSSKCPFDKRDEFSSWGCFYHCRIFQGPRPDQTEAIELVQLEINKLT